MMAKGLLERFYDAASIQRWNDFIRPVELTELDKQSHKIIIAYILAKFEEMERTETRIDWVKLIEGTMFEFLQRVVLTDIKPPVFYRMMKTKKKELNDFVLTKLSTDIRDINCDFEQKFKDYLFSEDQSSIERRILRAAHYLATNWEFKIIYSISPFIFGIDKIKWEIESQIEDHYDLVGVQRISLGKKTFGFIDLCGQLRFQVRWAQCPRVPKTSVLGHMLIVAMMSYLSSLQISACKKRCYNDFFAGLFHDLPEVLTRDIVDPVKRSVEGLQDVIKEYEGIQLEERVFPLLPMSLNQEIEYFVKDEFKNKIQKEGKIEKGITPESMAKDYNEDKFSPLDGELINACDSLATFIEACLSIRYGIESQPLKDAKKDIYEKFRGKKVSGINFGQLFDYFDGS